MNIRTGRLLCFFLAATAAFPCINTAHGQGMPPAAVSRAASEDKVVRAYSVQPSALDSVLRQLGERFPASSGVRITHDPRTAQILVIAPQAVQEQVAAILQPERGQGSAPAAGTSAAHPAAQNAPNTAPRGPKVV